MATSPCPPRRLLATLSADGYIKLWSASNPLRGPLAGLHVPLCCAAAGGGQGAAVGGAGAAAAAQWWQPRLAANQAGTAFAASSLSGEVPVVFLSGGEDLRLETGRPGHGGPVTALDWHPGGATLLTGSADGSLVLSDVQPRGGGSAAPPE